MFFALERVCGFGLQALQSSRACDIPYVHIRRHHRRHAVRTHDYTPHGLSSTELSRHSTHAHARAAVRQSVQCTPSPPVRSANVALRTTPGWPLGDSLLWPPCCCRGHPIGKRRAAAPIVAGAGVPHRVAIIFGARGPPLSSVAPPDRVVARGAATPLRHDSCRRVTAGGKQRTEAQSLRGQSRARLLLVSHLHITSVKY